MADLHLSTLLWGVVCWVPLSWLICCCMQLLHFHSGTILDIYRDARRKLSKRPWRVDDFDTFNARVYGSGQAVQQQEEEQQAGSSSAAPTSSTSGPAVAAGVSSQQQEQVSGSSGKGQVLLELPVYHA
jgi:hypothetical protein